MFAWIVSIVLYIGTMLYVLLLDRNPNTKQKQRKFVISWLYIFLCFGYMTGADWRNYEPLYYDDLMLGKYLNEPLSWLYFKFAPLLIKDYWLSLGICKCIHLFLLIKLLKELNEHWLSILVLLFPYQVCFMLIGNPFRFMMAMSVVYVAIIMYMRYNNEHGNRVSIRVYLKMVVFFVIAAMFHNSCLIMILLLPFFIYAKKIACTDNTLLVIFYIIIVLITSNVEFINKIIIGINQALIGAMAFKDYTETYLVEDNSRLLSIGNILKFFFFLFVISTKEKIVKSYPHGLLLYGLALSYCFLDRVLLLIPTGFRLAIPFVNFYITYIVLMLYTERKLSKIIVLYTFLMFTKTLWTAYDLIPYTNSIPYIIAGHKEYYERHLYNVEEYRERTGNDLILRIDQ